MLYYILWLDCCRIQYVAMFILTRIIGYANIVIVTWKGIPGHNFMYIVIR